MPPSAADQFILEARYLVKSFPGVRALRGVSLSVKAGEVVAVIGENGAGKSTLMKILAGVQSPDSGELLRDGQPVQIDSVRRAMELGIALIHQELNLSDNLDVGANVFLGREPHKFGLIDRKSIDRQTVEILARVGLDCSPRTLVSRLPVGQQQLVEIAKALSADARVLIMDEPTSSLSTHESQRLFDVICDLRKKGVSILYISHRLGEVKQLADRVVVLRDGANAGEIPREQISHDRMVKLMVGRDLSQFYVRTSHAPGKAMLAARQLRIPGKAGHSLNFQVRAGEVVGMAGLVGAGRTETLRVLFGIDRAVSGEVLVDGKPISLRSPRDAIAAGIALVPEDRKQQGLILEMSVSENISLATMKQHQRAGLITKGTEQSLAKSTIAQLGIKTPSPEQMAQFLSGGNQQKIVIGKWLAMKPRVLLLDEPTRGIDVGAKREIYKLMEDLAAQGLAVLFVSSEMEEILGMSDRALVMHEGRISGELTRKQLSEEAIMHLATGGDVPPADFAA